MTQEYPKMLYSGDKESYSSRIVHTAEEEQQFREIGLMDYADLLNKFSYCFTFSDKPCTCKTKQQNTADINRACKYSECPICQLQI